MHAWLHAARMTLACRMHACIQHACGWIYLARYTTNNQQNTKIYGSDHRGVC